MQLRMSSLNHGRFLGLPCLECEIVCPRFGAQEFGFTLLAFLLGISNEQSGYDAFS